MLARVGISGRENVWYFYSGMRMWNTITITPMSLTVYTLMRPVVSSAAMASWLRRLTHSSDTESLTALIYTWMGTTTLTREADFRLTS